MINLYNGDCLEVMDRLIAEGIKVDAIITDPPYGTTACKWDSIIPFEPMWDRLNRVIKPNGAIVLFGSEPFSSMLRTSNIKQYKHEWIWNKESAGNFIQAKNHPLRVHENVLVFSNGKVNYYPIMTDADPKNVRPLGVKKQKTDFMGKVSAGEFKAAKKYNPKKRYPKTILTYNARAKGCNNVNRVHPTQKPVDLIEYLIKTYTDQGQTVLDFTMGSGSTGVACINTSRSFIGIELDKEYFEIAKKRIYDTRTS